jgi:hypothetical protein
MSSVGNQSHGIGQEPERAFDGDKCQIEDNRNTHSQIDAVGRQRVCMAVVTV